MRTLFLGLLFIFANFSAASDKPHVENMLESGLEAIDSHNVLISRVSVPAQSSIPYHYHPSEEFLYVVSGSVFLKIKGQEDKLLKAGTTQKIPAKAVHSAATQDEASEIIVFRVHPKGLPVVMKPKE